MLDIEKIVDLRRQCFVDCVMKDNIVGVFGDVDESIIRAYGMIAVPLEGIDRYIFEYGTYNSCDVINSTMIYLNTQKCPILFSSKSYILSEKCDNMINAMKNETNKKIHIFTTKDKLKKYFEEQGLTFSNRRYTELQSQLLYIEELIDELYISNLSGIELFVVEFFSKYILNLEDRKKFLENILSSTKTLNKDRTIIKSPCPYGIYEKIDLSQKDKYYRIVRSFEDVDYTCKNCIIDSKFHENY